MAQGEFTKEECDETEGGESGGAEREEVGDPDE